MDKGLTEREAQVLLATAEYGGNELAAAALGVATQTVKNTLIGVREKTGATSTLQAYHRLVGGIRIVTETTQRIETEELP